MTQDKSSKVDKPDLSANITSQAVTAVEFAEYVGLTVQRVHQLVSNKILRKAARGAFDLKPCVHDYCKYLRDKSGGSDGAQSEREARVRLLEVKADIAELEHLEKARVMINGEVRKKQDSALAVILQNNLLSMADRLSPELAAETDAVAIHKQITAEVRNSLNSVITDMESTEVDDATMDIVRRDSLQAYEQNSKSDVS